MWLGEWQLRRDEISKIGPKKSALGPPRRPKIPFLFAPKISNHIQSWKVFVRKSFSEKADSSNSRFSGEQKRPPILTWNRHHVGNPRRMRQKGPTLQEWLEKFFTVNIIFLTEKPFFVRIKSLRGQKFLHFHRIIFPKLKFLKN